MLQIHCRGSPHEIGFKHGSAAKAAIHRSIAFYTWMFHDSAQLSWPSVRSLALDFEPVIRSKWTAYLDEMQGIAQGADLPLADIIALNVRTEIAFGLFSDGCTALSWRTAAGDSWLAQNWDWNPIQGDNLVQLTIEQAGKPVIKMITEAGIIGKIGLNAAGVGVCLNAIRAKGMDPTKLPCHLGLRMVLESTSREEAVRNLEAFGIASACHMLVADATGGIGLEWSSLGVQKIVMNDNQQIFHSNHFLVSHDGVEDTVWLEDSPFRVSRIEQLCRGIGDSGLDFDKLLEVFKDRANEPGAICRSAEGQSKSATLFNIIFNLSEKKARVLVGQPSQPIRELQLSF